MKKIMKKNIFALFSFFIFASQAKAIIEDTFYVRADAGTYDNVIQRIDSLKINPYSGHTLDIGLGYNINDGVRTELIYSHYINPELRTPEIRDENLRQRTSIRKIKGQIDVLMFKGYYDVASFKIIKFFIGGGVGIARVGEKMTGHDVKIIGRGSVFDMVSKPKIVDEKFKTQNNFAYTVAGGFSLNLNENTNVDFQYNWSDFGHAKSNNLGTKIKRKGHGVKMGIRYNIF